MCIHEALFFVKILSVFLGLAISGNLRAQWTEEFENGLSEWTGMKDFFETEGGFLRSKGPETSSCLYLSRIFGPSPRVEDRSFYQGVMTGDSVLCIEFGIALDFVPSSTNQLRLYLCSRDSVLGDTTEAFYLQLGAKGGENYWQLYRSGPDTVLCLWQGNRLFAKQNQMHFNLRAVYRPMPEPLQKQERPPAGSGMLKNKTVLKGNGFRKGGVLRIYYSEGDPQQEQWELDGDSLRLDMLADLLPDVFSPFYTGIRVLYRTASRANQYAFDYMKADRLPPSADPANPGSDSTDVGLAAYIPGKGALAINEILFNPRTGESRFVEIYNTTDTAFPVRNLALGVPGEKFWRYSLLTADTLLRIEPYSWLAAAKSAEDLSTEYRSCPENIVTAHTFPTLDDKAGYLRLVWIPPANDTVRDTMVIDEAVYTEDSHHWLLADPEGVSLERLGTGHSGSDPDNWMSAAETAGFATPGCENSHVRRSESGEDPTYFALDPPLVTPDNDGRNDYTVLRWNTSLTGCVCSAGVYDEWGRKVKTLCTQTLLGAGNDGIRYDATDAQGRILRPGLYIVYIDLLRPDGKRKRLRYPLAVG